MKQIEYEKTTKRKMRLKKVDITKIENTFMTTTNKTGKLTFAIPMTTTN